MDLFPLLPLLRSLPEYADARERAGRDSIALGLPRAARLPFAAALAAELNRPALLLTARSDRALVFHDELAAWLPGDQKSEIRNQKSEASIPYSAFRIHHFPEPNPLPYEYAPWGPRTIRQRIAAFASLASSTLSDSSSTFHPPPFILASSRALLTRTLPRTHFAAATHTLRVGDTVRLEKLLDTWVNAGYTNETIVSEPGHFSRRGGILDVWPPADEHPARIELFGDDIDAMKRFDAATQRSTEPVGAVTVTPAREVRAIHESPLRESPIHESFPPDSPIQPDLERLAAGVPFPTLEFFLPLIHPTQASLLDYLPEDALIFVDDWSELSDALNELESQALELRDAAIESGLIPPGFPAPHLSWSDLQEHLAHLPLIHLGALADDLVSAHPIDLGAHFSPGPRFGGQVKAVLDHLGSAISHQPSAINHPPSTIIVVTRQAARLAELWSESHSPLAAADSLAPPLSSLHFIQGALSDGFVLDSQLQLLTDSEIFGWARPEPRRRRARARADTPETSYADFNPGDYVVHIDYGIGRYAGLVKRTIEGIEREYLNVQFDGGDDLYVPIIQADRLTKYVGADDSEPALSRLGSADWSNTRARAQQAAEEVARELLDLYARRESTPGRAFAADTPWQRELEASFGYIETDDQLSALAEVKKDMERPRPMDRLICGDVGYGKTEVALRAAFKAVNDGAQVAVLVPTTVLAQQHHTTFAHRLAAFPAAVEMLSRFRSRAEQEAIVAKLESGEVDIVIGTHRLLSKDVQFKDLGLLIIDEEQRFGVTHKERLKQMRTEVDVLTLTATPIPRTLYMSLTGIRDISMIATAPDERLPVITHTGSYSEKAARQAILRELDRGGQVFFVHNRVQSIGVARQRLERLVPEARIGVAHGQMNEHELERVMAAFTDGDVDVLLCTSIIESGLDIPNANTLIVDRADTFGLAQLYQLRGRVGRGANRAYAYFFHEKTQRMTAEARERLDTIAEQTELGAGYGIAMRDLEMRGAGDILGARQHGHVAAVGFHLYTRLLSRAVSILKIQTPSPTQTPTPTDFAIGSLEVGVSVDLPIPATLPSDYIPDRTLRLRLYRRLAEIKDEAALKGMAAELTDRFGELPDSVENLLFLMRIKLLAQRAGVEAVAREEGQIVLRNRLWEAEEGRAQLSGRLPAEARVSKGKVWLPKAADNWRERLVEALERLGERG
ncbi:MAG: transcription-repair coupling factor [Chloroflexi bacterium]|nr:transcription-repair coupling factor [Chloroflexota bacterium]